MEITATLTCLEDCLDEFLAAHPYPDCPTGLSSGHCYCPNPNGVVVGTEDLRPHYHAIRRHQELSERETRKTFEAVAFTPDGGVKFWRCTVCGLSGYEDDDLRASIRAARAAA